jgi:pyridoxamine 5'-phosphate oxidase family protein
MTTFDSPRTLPTSPRIVFTEREIAYLASRQLGRIATVDANGRPRVVATGFSVNPMCGTIELGGFNLASTRRVNDIRTNPHVSLIVDDKDDSAPGWVVRGVEIRGIARLHRSTPPSQLPPNLVEHGWMEITPTSIRSWGLT